MSTCLCLSLRWSSHRFLMNVFSMEMYFLDPKIFFLARIWIIFTCILLLGLIWSDHFIDSGKKRARLFSYVVSFCSWYWCYDNNDVMWWHSEWQCCWWWWWWWLCIKCILFIFFNVFFLLYKSWHFFSFGFICFLSSFFVSIFNSSKISHSYSLVVIKWPFFFQTYNGSFLFFVFVVDLISFSCCFFRWCIMLNLFRPLNYIDFSLKTRNNNNNNNYIQCCCCCRCCRHRH